MITYNAQPQDPGLLDLLDQLKRSIFLGLNCHAHGTVQGFNSSNQTITATINYQKTVFISESPGQTPVPTAMNYPAIVNCPVYFPQGGGGSLTFPVEAGDQALIAFNDRDMDNYLAAGVISQSNTGRAHAFSDAFAFVGVNPFNKALSNFDMARALLQMSGAKVGCSSAGVLIEANDVKLSTAVTALFTAINDIITGLTATFANCAPLASPTPPPPATQWGTEVTTINSALTSAQDDFEEVLE